MTPNPQNIGAAPEGITLEVGKTYENADGSERFHIFMRHGEHVHPFVFRATRLKTGGVVNFGAAGEYWPGEDPHLWDLAREVPDAASVPEPQAKGPSPSEVPQPGEGVDFAALAAACFKDIQFHESLNDGMCIEDVIEEHMRALAVALGKAGA